MSGKTSSLCLMAINLVAVFGFLLLYVHFTLQTSFFMTEKFSSQQKTGLTRGNNYKTNHKERKIRGHFAVHEWKNLCKGSLQHLFKSTVFPKHPDTIHFVDKSLISSRNQNSGRRMSGYLHVPETGVYMFLIRSRGGSELWLSESKHHKDLELVANVHPEDTESKTEQKIQYSTETFLSEGISHPVEIFHFGVFLEVFWIKPGKHEFEVIGEKHISHDTKSLGHEVLASCLYKNKNKEMDEKTVLKFSLISFISPAWVRNKAMPVCPFGLEDGISGRKESRFAVLKTNVEVLFSDPDGYGLVRWKEKPEVRHLVEFYMKGLEKANPRRFKAKRVYKVEKLSLSTTHEPLYLLEIELEVDGLDYPERAVEYIHKPNTSHFCYPKGFNLNRVAFINVIVVVKNETKWLKLFIDRIEKAFEEALEVDLHVIVVDFDETGLDIESILKETTLKDKFTVTKMDGPYSKSRGFNRGASLVKGNNPIILACDVHVDIPDTLFEDTRMHCIEGRMTFAPVVLQLNCSSYPGIQNPSGSWCFQGYDVIGIYKKDWTRISGMDETLFEQKADWDLVLRIKNSGMSVTRFKYPGLYRYYMPPRSKSSESNLDMKLGYLQKDV